MDEPFNRQRDACDSDRFDYFKLSHEYAWNWFQYHANQRMIVFRFYFIIVAVLAASYLRSIEVNFIYLSLLSSLLIAVTSVLFWRWDIRSMDLTRIAEEYLGQSELILSHKTGINEILIVKSANEKNTKISSKYISAYVFSYRQIIWTVYLITGVLGLAGSLFAGYQLLVN